uniref:acyl-UDP-N-acetylglucosamine o-acyltransferase n=1 Tax=Galdieria phlegrea TaxID=1389228 RepID=UPI0023D81BC5|nr:acyl-UDP-N-acetylglucosamine o-acyltransferase [Galdieria phlegrea]WDA99824.1 acyl-UDP-N-acetylglucosamine o-acyltransferase [Galdieria phlegrea]|eukprot:jgi/Galph1/4565/GphlegSOOS_G3212.1
MCLIHKTAIVDPKANIENNVIIGAYSIIGANVTIKSSTIIGSHVIIDGNTYIGYNNKIYFGASIGLEPQDLKYDGKSKGLTKIGDNNSIREYVTIHRPTKENEITEIKNNNLLMAYVHVAHNCQIDSNIVIANAVSLAGHVKVNYKAVIGGLSGIHQFVEIGSLAMVGGMSRIIKNVPPFVIAEGNPAIIRSLNIVGLKRANLYNNKEYEYIQNVYNMFYKSDLYFHEALEKIKQISLENKYANMFYEFLINSTNNISSSSRGLTPFYKNVKFN